MKQFRDIAIWTMIVAYLAVAFGFISEKQKALVCDRVTISIVDSMKNGFVTERQVRSYLEKKKVHLVGKSFDEIDLDTIEAIMDDYPPVENTEVYKTSDGKVVIDVKQRSPILRVIDAYNQSYYIDRNGYVMRTSENFTSHVIVANGFIKTNFPINSKVNILALEKKNQGKKSLVANLYRLGHYITENRFWNAQIQQIYVTPSGDFELVPRVGSQIIIFGDYSNCETKFSNLMSLYKNGFPVTGWNIYETINLKYKGQVICTKRN